MKRFLPVVLPLLAACSTTPDLAAYVTPYRIDVRQGNFVTQEMVVQLRPGLTREQVRFVLGSPLVTDLFHADRWDYIYRFQPGHGEPIQRRLTVFFIDNKLSRVEGDVVAETAAAGPAPAASRLVEVPPADDAPRSAETK